MIEIVSKSPPKITIQYLNPKRREEEKQINQSYFTPLNDPDLEEIKPAIFSRKKNIPVIYPNQTQKKIGVSLEEVTLRKQKIKEGLMSLKLE